MLTEPWLELIKDNLIYRNYHCPHSTTSISDKYFSLVFFSGQQRKYSCLYTGKARWQHHNYSAVWWLRILFNYTHLAKRVPIMSALKLRHELHGLCFQIQPWLPCFSQAGILGMSRKYSIMDSLKRHRVSVPVVIKCQDQQVDCWVSPSSNIHLLHLSTAPHYPNLSILSRFSPFSYFPTVYSSSARI